MLGWSIVADWDKFGMSNPETRSTHAAASGVVFNFDFPFLPNLVACVQSHAVSYHTRHVFGTKRYVPLSFLAEYPE